MASPFKVFRKHQKLMLAGLTILAMFSFVFLGTISDLLGTRQGPQNPVVVRTSKYGKLTQRDLAFMRQDHRLFLQIISKIYTQALGINPETSLKLVERNFGSCKRRRSGKQLAEVEAGRRNRHGHQRSNHQRFSPDYYQAARLRWAIFPRLSSNRGSTIINFSILSAMNCGPWRLLNYSS